MRMDLRSCEIRLDSILFFVYHGDYGVSKPLERQDQLGRRRIWFLQHAYTACVCFSSGVVSSF